MSPVGKKNSTQRTEAPSLKEASSSKEESQRRIEIPPSITVKRLSELLSVSGVDVIKQLMRNGVMATINQVIDFDTAAIIAADFSHEAAMQSAPVPTIAVKQPQRPAQEDKAAGKQPRPPVVTVMGHVDHGKTTLLDVIRQTNVIATEAGGITQHIGAYQVDVSKQKITFIDTPGHEAFTAMRARGARVTDIAILVVAADDGVMPQTMEAIAHARAAGVPIVVAITKIDKPEASVEKVKAQLAEQGLLIEEWGGDTVCVSVSGKTQEGISGLLENILIVAEMLELKANPDAPAMGTIIEAALDKTRGPLATVLVQNGTLNQGDIVIVGNTWGKLKAIFNDKGKRIKKAEPGTPAKILGLSDVPQAGDALSTIGNEREGRALVEQIREEKQRASSKATRALTLDDLMAQVRAGEARELNIVLKTDVQGSIEPIKESLQRLSTDQIKVRIVHSGSGTITEGDVLLALASKGIIVGFNTQPTLGAQHMAESQKVDIRRYKIIYELVEEIDKAVKGMLEPTWVDIIEGRAEVRAVFVAARRQKAAGVYITEGKISRNALAWVLRQGQVIHESAVSSLRRFKDDVNELAAGLEGGIGIEGFHEFQVGDIIETYRKEKSSDSSHQPNQPPPSRGN